MNRQKAKRALILGSGEDVPGQAFLTSAEIIICADGGVELAEKWGLQPDLIIGDQDSISPSSLKHWQAQGVRFLKYPVKKDHTDIELAVNYALNVGVSEISLIGAWGSRADHSLGNVALLYRLAKEGIKNELLTSCNRLTAIIKECTAEVAVGSTVSLLPLDEKVRGVYTQGLYYQLSGQILWKGSTLGISNQAIDKNISVQCAHGVLLAVFEQ